MYTPHQFLDREDFDNGKWYPQNGDKKQRLVWNVRKLQSVYRRSQQINILALDINQAASFQAWVIRVVTVMDAMQYSGGIVGVNTSTL